LGLLPVRLPIGLLAARGHGAAAGLLRALFVAVAPPAPSPATPLPLLLAVLAPGLLGMGRRPRFGLCLIAMWMLALLLRMVGAGPLLPALLVALLVAAETAAIAPAACSSSIRRAMSSSRIGRA